MSDARDIRLCVRVRPGASKPAVRVDARGAVSVEGDTFTFPTRVVEGSDQRGAFDALAAPVVARVLEGYDCALIAYGQTGSGKTHTVFGPPGCLVEAAVSRWRDAAGGSEPTDAPDEWGLFPRAVMALMHHPDVKNLRASAVEVYNELVFDLMNDRAQLSVGSAKTQIGNRVAGRPDRGGSEAQNRYNNGVHPASCTCHACFKIQERAKEEARLKRAERAAGAAVVGKRNDGAKETTPESFNTVGETLVTLETPEALARFARTVEATRVAKSHALNDRSSRSHCLVRVWVSPRDAKKAKVSMVFADLAGSERIAKTGATGEAAVEAQRINGSLSALGRVIKVLGETKKKKNTHVPYRDAALTMLLRDAFGGGSVTSVTLAVANERGHADETACTLRFGARMVAVKNTGVAGRTARKPAPRVELDAIKRQLANATAELTKMEQRGEGGGFVPDGPATEVRSLRDGMERLAALDAELATLKIAIAETKGGAGGGRSSALGSLRSRLRERTAKAEVLRSVVERQKTIKAIWAEPTPGFKGKQGEVAALRVALDLAEC